MATPGKSSQVVRKESAEARADTTATPDLDRIVRLTAGYFGAPIAVIGGVEPERIRFLARHGIEQNEVPRAGSFSAETVLKREALVVPDAQSDERFAGSQLVAGPPGVRFYAGIPLFVSGKVAVGTLAVMDLRARKRFTAAQVDALREFAVLAAREMERRGTAGHGVSQESNEWLDGIAGALPAMVWLTDTAGHCTLLNRFPWDPSGADGPDKGTCDWHNVIPPEEGETDSKDDLAFECRIQGRDGKDRWILEQARPRFHPDGSFAGYIGMCLDITDRKRAEMELLASREQLRQLAAHVECAREQERIRIAREIHDELGQILTVLKMDAEAVQSRYRTSVPRPLKDMTRRMAGMITNLDGAIVTVRRIASELRPGVLDHLGLAAAIEWQMQEFESHTGIRCHATRLPEELPLNAHQSTAVFRIFQEILTNVGRHASATAVKVDVDLDASNLKLRVRDNGRGFDKLRLSDPKALGLLGMRERALLLGGSIDIESSGGAGTTVTLQIPLSVSAPA